MAAAGHYDGSPSTPMSDGNKELSLDVKDLSEASTGEKQKSEVKLRSKAWEHFTKLIKEDGTYEKCQCNHCNKLFTCSSRSGTTHLLRHITEGICPVFKKDKVDRRQIILSYMRGSSEPRSSMMSCKFNQGLDQSGHETVDVRNELLPVGLDELSLDVNDLTEASIGEKRKREVKLRSKAWEHFTKLIKEDGTYDKCQCNHCYKLFTCSSRSGTTHLLRHITEGICPVYKKEKKDGPQTTTNYMRRSSEPKSSMASWKFNKGLDQSSHETTDMRDEFIPLVLDDLERQTCEVLEDDYVTKASPPVSGKFSQQPALKRQSRGESWMDELRACVSKLVDLTNERLPKGSSIKTCLAVAAPDYSIATALRCLNEMEDIPQSSEMYLDAFEVLKDDGERECFICLPPEPRRRWLQRMLHRRYPLRYNCNF